MKHFVPLPQLGFSEALNAAVSKIFQTNGRARRSEYWWIRLFVTIINIVLTPLTGLIVELAIIPLTIRRLHDTGRSGWWYGCSFILFFLFIIFLFVDLFMVIINAKGNADLIPYVLLAFMTKYIVWIILINIYNVVLLILLCIDREPEANKYGESPKYIAIEDPEERDSHGCVNG